MWTVNNQPVDELGISVASGTFKTFGTSFALLDSAHRFDANPPFQYGDAVVIRRNGVRFFQGKVAAPSKKASAEYEGHDYPIEDAWADLEETIYQEEWRVGGSAYLFPRAVLGLDKSGDPLTIGQQVREVIEYAASVGVNLEMGSVPEGEVLWPEEVENMSCAEVIRKCLQFHPDWIPWIDHSAATPTLNVSKTTDGGMPTRMIATNGTGNVESFTVTDRGDLRPKAVRIVYEYASQIGDEVYRNAVIDKFPASGPDGGPGMLCATIPLAGQQMQIQKSRIRTRPIPLNGDKSNVAKRFLRANYPRLATVNLGHYDIEEFSVEFIEEDLSDTHKDAPPINERAPRLMPTGLSQLPNQLVEGNIEDWMRKRVGRVKFSAKIKPSSSASGDMLEKLNVELPEGTTTATNAVTRIYKNMTQWSRAEDAPTGIARGVYESMHAAYQAEGEVTLSTGELTGERYHGYKLTLGGTGTENVPIHTVAWDIPSGRTTLGFGPVPQLAPADFREQQRRLRARKVTWWSKEERGDDKLGAENKPSAKGDTVGGYHAPQTVFDGNKTAPAAAMPCPFGEIITYREGTTTKTGIRGGAVTAGDKTWQMPHQELNLNSAGEWLIYIKIDITANTNPTKATTLSGIQTSTTPSWEKKVYDSDSGDVDDYENQTIPDIFPTTNAGSGKAIVPLGVLKIKDGNATFEGSGCGNVVITHCPGVLGYNRG